MRKTLILIAGILLVATLSLGQTVHYANQVTVAWDEVTQMENGTPISVGTVSYEVFTRTGGVEVLLGETDVTQYTITLDDYEVYDVGVRTVLTQGTERFQSEITWSVDADPPFVVQRYPAPAEPTGLEVL